MLVRTGNFMADVREQRSLRRLIFSGLFIAIVAVLVGVAIFVMTRGPNELEVAIAGSIERKWRCDEMRRCVARISYVSHILNRGRSLIRICEKRQGIRILEKKR